MALLGLTFICNIFVFAFLKFQLHDFPCNLITLACLSPSLRMSTSSLDLSIQALIFLCICSCFIVNAVIFFSPLPPFLCLSLLLSLFLSSLLSCNIITSFPLLPHRHYWCEHYSTQKGEGLSLSLIHSLTHSHSLTHMCTELTEEHGEHRSAASETQYVPFNNVSFYLLF